MKATSVRTAPSIASKCRQVSSSADLKAEVAQVDASRDLGLTVTIPERYCSVVASTRGALQPLLPSPRSTQSAATSILPCHDSRSAWLAGMWLQWFLLLTQCACCCRGWSEG